MNHLKNYEIVELFEFWFPAFLWEDEIFYPCVSCWTIFKIFCNDVPFNYLKLCTWFNFWSIGFCFLHQREKLIDPILSRILAGNILPLFESRNFFRTFAEFLRWNFRFPAFLERMRALIACCFCCFCLILIWLFFHFFCFFIILLFKKFFDVLTVFPHICFFCFSSVFFHEKKYKNHPLKWRSSNWLNNSNNWSTNLKIVSKLAETQEDKDLSSSQITNNRLPKFQSELNSNHLISEFESSCEHRSCNLNFGLRVSLRGWDLSNDLSVSWGNQNEFS